MSFDLPTAADVKTRFPELVNVGDALVTEVILEASRWVDDTWAEDDYQVAIKFLTAHMLVTGGALSASGGPTPARGALRSQSLGDASEVYESITGGAAALAVITNELLSTSYGKRFVALRNVNQRGPVVV